MRFGAMLLLQFALIGFFVHMLPVLNSLLGEGQISALRNRVMAHYNVTLDEAKNLLTRLVYGGSLARWKNLVGRSMANDLQEVEAFIREINWIVERLLAYPAYRYVVEAAHAEWRKRHGDPVDAAAADKRKRFTASYILQELEDVVLYTLESWCAEVGWEVGGLFFDGFCARPSRRQLPGKPEDVIPFVEILNNRFVERACILRVACKAWAHVPSLGVETPERALAVPPTVLGPRHPHVVSCNALLLKKVGDSLSEYIHSHSQAGHREVSHIYRTAGIRTCIYGRQHWEGDFRLEMRGFTVMYACHHPECFHRTPALLGTMPAFVTSVDLTCAGLDLTTFDILAPSRVTAQMRQSGGGGGGGGGDEDDEPPREDFLAAQQHTSKGARGWFREYMSKFFFSIAHPARTVAEVVYSDNSCAHMCEYHLHLEQDFKSLLMKVESRASRFILEGTSYKNLYQLWEGEIAARNMVFAVKVREVFQGFLVMSYGLQVCLHYIIRIHRKVPDLLTPNTCRHEPIDA
jgi:hypothetical protein